MPFIKHRPGLQSSALSLLCTLFVFIVARKDIYPELWVWSPDKPPPAPFLSFSFLLISLVSMTCLFPSRGSFAGLVVFLLLLFSVSCFGKWHQCYRKRQRECSQIPCRTAQDAFGNDFECLLARQQCWSVVHSPWVAVHSQSWCQQKRLQSEDCVCVCMYAIRDMWVHMCLCTWYVCTHGRCVGYMCMCMYTYVIYKYMWLYVICAYNIYGHMTCVCGMLAIACVCTFICIHMHYMFIYLPSN